MPRFGKEREAARKEELDRQAAEEVERLTRRAGPQSGMGGGGPNIGRVGIPSPLERIAEELRDAPRPSMRRQAPARRPAPQPQQAFTPMPSGSVGSSFGPGGLNPGPRTGVTAPPPSAFGGSGYDDDYGGAVTGPPVYNAGEPDEEEEMSITELALMDHAAHTGHNPEDLVIQYDAGTAEEMRDQAMRAFYERQQTRGPGAQTNNPFAPAGMRRGPGGGAPAARSNDPAAAGGALAQRLANRRRREEEEARRARGEGPGAGAAAATRDADTDEGALARVLARRRQLLAAPESTPEPTPAPGRRHAAEREERSPGMRVVPLPPVEDEEPAPARRAPARGAPAKKAGARKASAAAAATSPPAAKTATAGPAKARSTGAPAKTAKKAGATLVPPAPPKTAGKKASKSAAAAAPPAKQARAASKAPAGKQAPAAKKAPGAKAASSAKQIFCMECGEKNPAIAKFCFNCGNRLAVPEG